MILIMSYAIIYWNGAATPLKGLVKYVFFIVFNLKFLQKIKVFCTEGPLAVVRLLILYIFENSRHLRFCIGKCAVTFLPIKPVL